MKSNNPALAKANVLLLDGHASELLVWITRFGIAVAASLFIGILGSLLAQIEIWIDSGPAERLGWMRYKKTQEFWRSLVYNSLGLGSCMHPSNFDDYHLAIYPDTQMTILLPQHRTLNRCRASIRTASQTQ